MIGELIGFIFSLMIIAIPVLLFGLPFILAILALFIRIVYEYEKGVLFAFGKYVGLRKPGFNLIIPFYHRLDKVDLRITTLDIAKQEVMTKDNVPVNINAVVYFRVVDPTKAILNVEDFMYAVAKYGQTSLRNVAGDTSLDELLSERQKIAKKLLKIVDEATDPWGIDVTAIELQDIELPETMKRVMAKQAEAEREKRATIIKAEGEAIAADDISKAAKKLATSKGALHLRTLESLNDIASDKTNKISFYVPMEVLRALEEVD